MNKIKMNKTKIKEIIFNPICVGIILPFILSLFGILVGQRGVDYYGEVHSTFHNCIVHTIFMPFTTYGMLLWIPNTLIYLSGKKYYDYDKKDGPHKLDIPTNHNKYLSISNDGEYLLFSFKTIKKEYSDNFEMDFLTNSFHKIGAAKLSYD